jgi:hypothetical protein
MPAGVSGLGLHHARQGIERPLKAPKASTGKYGFLCLCSHVPSKKNRYDHDKNQNQPHGASRQAGLPGLRIFRFSTVG